MARIVLGAGTSHGPLALVEGEEWVKRGEQDKKYDKLNTIDGRFLNYAQLVAERGEPYEKESGLANLSRQSDLVQGALTHLAAEIRKAAPDVVLIVGDDQGELFGIENMPAFSIFYGDELLTHPLGDGFDTLFWQPIVRGYAMDEVRSFPAHGAFAKDLIVRLIDKHVDVGGAASVPDPKTKGFGHAFGFVINRLMQGLNIPVVPVLLNTYFQPNAPRPGRCYKIGQLLGEAIAESEFDLKVAVIASGGLSHFLCEEELDRQVLRALRDKDSQFLASLPKPALLSGSSEILNWILAAGALEHLEMRWNEYLPVRRTPAGTGIGMGFALWS